MPGYCFWILTNGTIIIPFSRHISAVVAVPTAFGEIDETIIQTFKDYNENPLTNHEGRAREAIMLRVINRNHIRIRKNRFRNNQSWSIQLFELIQERKNAISLWANHILSESLQDRYADVTIHQLINDSKLLTSLDKLAAQYVYDGEELLIVTQTELMRIYKK